MDGVPRLEASAQSGLVVQDITGTNVQLTGIVLLALF